MCIMIMIVLRGLSVFCKIYLLHWTYVNKPINPTLLSSVDDSSSEEDLTMKRRLDDDLKGIVDLGSGFWGRRGIRGS